MFDDKAVQSDSWRAIRKRLVWQFVCVCVRVRAFVCARIETTGFAILFAPPSGRSALSSIYSAVRDQDDYLSVRQALEWYRLFFFFNT